MAMSEGQKSVVRNRDESVDMLKGFGILLMIFDHVRFGNLSHNWISSFHMPLFFIVSGYLFRSRSYKSFFKRKWLGLWIPYLVFGTLFLAISLSYSKNIDLIPTQFMGLFLLPTSISRMPLSAPLWFIPCIFLVEFVFLTLYKVIKNPWLLCAVILGIGGLGVAYANFSLPTLPFSFGPCLFSLLFYYFGYLIHEYNKLRQWILRDCLDWQILVFGAAGTVCAYLNGITDIRSVRYGIFPLFLISGISLTLFCWGVFISMAKNPSIKSACSFLAYFGNNSMVFLCCNYAVIKGIKFLLKRLFVSQSGLIDFSHNLLTYLISIVLIFLFDKLLFWFKLTWMVGKSHSS